MPRSAITIATSTWMTKGQLCGHIPVPGSSAARAGMAATEPRTSVSLTTVWAVSRPASPCERFQAGR
ncbi:Uncharacterised protein [Mycobacteroides abscessus subsp. abscessus]|nr:Uncharacterised protein [Mycobacteroides abscessus subsp. abscessus]